MWVQRDKGKTGRKKEASTGVTQALSLITHPLTFKRRRVPSKLLPQGHGHGILQVRASDLHNPLPPLRLCVFM